MSPRVTGRLFLLVLVGSFPMVALVAVSDSISAGLSPLAVGTVRLAVVALGLAWAAVVAVFGGAYMASDATDRVDGPDDAALGRLGDLLRRRDHQLHRLATFAATAPVTDGPSAVASHVVGMARDVTGDGTWVLAVHGEAEQPVPGVYDGESADASPITDLHRWAASTSADAPAVPVVATGPWGAFLLLRLPPGDRYRAQLLAPWEGRAQPSGADSSLLSLIAQHAGVTLDHAALYARVNTQAQELKRLSVVQRDFLRAVTHDLQSPLASISATASDLREQGQRSTADLELQTIGDQADRLHRMVTQLLTMSALEAGVVHPQSDVFRMQPIIDRVIRSMHLPAGSIVQSSSGPDRLAVGDPDRLEQVLWALLDNAIKYSPHGSVIRVESSVVTEGSGPYEEVCVSDSGIGMDPATLRHAFDQFYRSESARKMAPNGSGIGLFTAQGLIALMGGTIEVESRLGQGTRMRIRLPAELVEPEGAEV